jgi:hypothetical protein
MHTRQATAVALALLLSGCVRSTTATYPDQWSPRAATAAAACPALAGRYHDQGEVAHGTTCRQSRTPGRGEYRCDTSLSRNIAEVTAGDWVELRQPDADTLLIVSSDPTIDVKELHRSRGDFSCSAQGLERHLHASLSSIGDNSRSSAGLAVYNGMGTAFNAASAGFLGVRSLTRTFTTTADGSLIMDVSVSETGVVLLIPFHMKDEGYVRWSRVEAPAVDAAGSPAGTAGTVDAPSAHVARFTSSGGILHPVSVTTETGDTAERGNPVALAPGKRWVQLQMGDHTLRPLRDFDAVYGFELDAVAGHHDRLAHRPDSCLPPGNVDAALASRLIGRTQLALVDEAPGGKERPFTVGAVCIAGWPPRLCAVSDPAREPSSDGSLCLLAQGSSRGFYGRPRGI